MSAATTALWWKVSIGRKIVMALTGMFLCTFLIMHLAGNLLLLKNDNGIAFNEYATFMVTSPLIRIMEFVLLGGFLFHIVYGITLTLQNQAARPVGYKMVKSNETSSFYSRFMIWSGILVLVYLGLHLYQFTIVHRFTEVGTTTSMYDLVKQTFNNQVFAVVYVLAQIFLSFHLSHGFQSMFQSLGLQVNEKVGNKIKLASQAFSILICGGFATIPLYFLIQSLLTN